MVNGATVAVVGILAAAGVGAAYLLTQKGSGGGGGGSGHGTLVVNGRSDSISTTQTGTLNWSITGVTPGALIQFGYDTQASGQTGYYVANTATADSTGKASGTVALTAGGNDMVGATFYALAYDTAIGSLSGYSQPVAINIVQGFAGYPRGYGGSDRGPGRAYGYDGGSVSLGAGLADPTISKVF